VHPRIHTGTYSATNGSTVCLSCLAGSYAPNTGSCFTRSNRTHCSAQTHMRSIDSHGIAVSYRHSCITPSRLVTAHRHTHTHTQTRVGMCFHSRADKTTAPTELKKQLLHTHTNTRAGSTACLPCPIDTETAQPGAASCVPCPDERYTSSVFVFYCAVACVCFLSVALLGGLLVIVVRSGFVFVVVVRYRKCVAVCVFCWFVLFCLFVGVGSFQNQVPHPTNLNTHTHTDTGSTGCSSCPSCVTGQRRTVGGVGVGIARCAFVFCCFLYTWCCWVSVSLLL